VPEALLHDADFAMYQAKAAGGGQHQVVDRAARLAADERAHLEGDLRAAVRGDLLQLAYQPIAEIGSGRSSARRRCCDGRTRTGDGSRRT
jgi:predicted signal transduction protein with EAL and GGDEF domain